MTSTVRPPAVAGRFYSGDPRTLAADVHSFLITDQARQSAIGCVVPHAGYMYSGHVAGAVFSHLDLPRRFIILCPNHTGRGVPLSIMSHGSWQTPLGPAAIDENLAEKLKRQYSLLEEGAEAHRSEHAIEVELPFLQVLQPQFTFVPIALGTGQLPPLIELGQAIAEVIERQSEPVLIVASSDMNHYESDAVTRIKDGKAIDRMLALDAAGLYDLVIAEHISMCGFGPAVTMLAAAKHLGASSAALIEYATSGDVSGDREHVVGYAGILVGR